MRLNSFSDALMLAFNRPFRGRVAIGLFPQPLTPRSLWNTPGGPAITKARHVVRRLMVRQLLGGLLLGDGEAGVCSLLEIGKRR